MHLPEQTQQNLLEVAKFAKQWFLKIEDKKNARKFFKSLIQSSKMSSLQNDEDLKLIYLVYLVESKQNLRASILKKRLIFKQIKDSALYIESLDLLIEKTQKRNDLIKILEIVMQSGKIHQGESLERLKASIYYKLDEDDAAKIVLDRLKQETLLFSNSKNS